MDCEQAIERLPWLLNRSLGAEERRQVESHLGDCPLCREALAETREAWEIFAQHVPAADLVAYAADEPRAISRETLERHLASCPQCAAELEMARAGRLLLENEEVAVMRPPAQATERGGAGRRLRFWQGSALAASLVGLIAVGSWVETAERARTLAASLAAARSATPAAPKAAGADRQATPAADDGQIVVNEQILNLEPAGESTAVRAGDAAPPIQELQPGTAPLMLMLHQAARDNAKHHAAELVDATGAVHGMAEPVLDRDGYYTMSVPRRLLEPGTSTIRLYSTDAGPRSLVASYPLTLKPSKP